MAPIMFLIRRLIRDQNKLFMEINFMSIHVHVVMILFSTLFCTPKVKVGFSFGVTLYL